MKNSVFLLSLIIFLIFNLSFAASLNSESVNIGLTFLWLALLIIFSKIGALLEKIKQSPVVGEILIGILLGNLAFLGINFFEGIKSDKIIYFLAQIGVVILLFQIGLESNIEQMKRVGLPSFLVAIIGVVLPFLLGTYVVGPYFFPDANFNTYLFLGATLTATSVGITARVFRDLGKQNTPEAKIILGAAVIDDILGLIILAVVQAIVVTNAINFIEILNISLKAIGFILLAIVVGNKLANFISKLFSFIHTGVGMKFALAVSFAFVFSYLAQEIGLAPIVGAFAAGLILDPVHFRLFSNPKIIDDLEKFKNNLDNKNKENLEEIINHHSDRHIEDLIEPLAFLFVPLFFIYTGLNVNISTLFNLQAIYLAIGITIAAIVGKYLSGFSLFLFRNYNNLNKNIIGLGMIPRGEVGLIFASIGKEIGVINDLMFSTIIIMILFTTLVTPIVLSVALKRS
ncbi:MAG: cation:proton antiporter [Patescibacteria group bacterium]|nr:cation:proton antiporter [Patescibacteria group bacterium]